MQLRWANGPGERKSFMLESKCMATKKGTKKRSAAKKKSVSSASSKKRGRKKSGSPGIITRAKKVVREVLTGAVAGAATGAVVGAAEAGTKATGIDQSTKKTSKGKNRSAKR